TADLAGRVALDGQPRVLGVHAFAVVFDADQPLAAAVDGDRDPRGPGVQRVLAQLLDDGGRALDDFAGGDLVREIRSKPVNFRHRFPDSRYPRSEVRGPRSEVRYPISDIRYPISDIRYPISDYQITRCARASRG